MKENPRSLILVTFIIIAAALAAGCAAGGEETDGRIIVTDSVGRQVEVPPDPQRIDAVEPFAAQMVIMYGLGDRLKATVGGVQRDLLLQEMSPTLADAAVMSGGDPNVEELMRLQVDLMFIRGEAYANEQKAEQLYAAGIPFVVIDYNSMASQMEAAMVIGEAVGKSEQAARFVEYYQSAIDTAAKIAAQAPEGETRRLYHSVNEAVRTNHAGSLGADWISVTGAHNVALEGGHEITGRDAITTLEQIYVWDPDLIICNESGVSGYILEDSKWSGLLAVREGRVYQIPIGVSRWGHPNSSETPLAILWLSALLNPEHATEIDMEGQMRYFYKTFFDYDMTDEVIDMVFSGEGIRPPSMNVGSGRSDR